MRVKLKKKKLKRIAWKIAKGIFSGVFIVVLGSVGIDAADHRDNLSESLIGRIFVGEQEGPCPADMSLVESPSGDFCVDTYEVSLSDSCPHPQPSSANESKYDIDSPKCEILSVKDAKPWTYLTANQAAMACRKDGKRLPTNREWSYAAAGTPDPSRDWTSDDCQVSANWGSQPGLTGSGARCESYAGAYDMIGNVWEWVDGSVDDGKIDGKDLPKEGFVRGVDESDAFPSETGVEAEMLYNDDYYWLKDTKTRAIARGGYWGNKEQAGQYAHYIVSTPIDSGEAIGFRCVMDAKKR